MNCFEVRLQVFKCADDYADSKYFPFSWLVHSFEEPSGDGRVTMFSFDQQATVSIPSSIHAGVCKRIEAFEVEDAWVDTALMRYFYDYELTCYRHDGRERLVTRKVQCLNQMERQGYSDELSGILQCLRRIFEGCAGNCASLETMFGEYPPPPLCR
jgi:hypothetical protein